MCSCLYRQEEEEEVYRMMGNVDREPVLCQNRSKSRSSSYLYGHNDRGESEEEELTEESKKRKRERERIYSVIGNLKIHYNLYFFICAAENGPKVPRLRC